MNSQRSDHKPSENKLLILSINIEINSTKIKSRWRGFVPLDYLGDLMVTTKLVIFY